MPHPPALPLPAKRLLLLVCFLLALAPVAGLLKLLFFPAWSWWGVTAPLWAPWLLSGLFGGAYAFRSRRA